MTKKMILRWTPALLVLLALGACSSSDSSSPLKAPADANKTPATAVTSLATLMKAGNIDGVLRASLPADDYRALCKAYASSEFKTKPITDAQRKKFASKMAKLTAPGAEQALFKELQPTLAQFDSKYKAQLPMYVGMGQTMAASAIDKSKTMTPSDKQQAKDMLQALAHWVQTTNWGDEAKAKQAIAIAVDTARKMDIKTLDQARALTYDQAMGKYSQAWGALKQVLVLYGMDINQMLDSVQAKTVTSSADQATVAYKYTVLGQPLSGKVKLVQRDGHWYNPKFVAQFEQGLADHATAAAASTASASTTGVSK